MSIEFRKFSHLLDSLRKGSYYDFFRPKPVTFIQPLRLKGIMKNDELHIITSILAGNTERFSYFLDTYGQQIFTLIVRMVGSPEDAEELTQDTFMKAFRHLSDFNGKSSFSTWLYRIAYNTALSSLRKQPNEVLSVDDRLWNNLTENEIDRALDEEDEERIELLQRALEKLTPDERALVTLFYEEDRPIAEICHILNQTEGNVKVKLYRIRKKLYILIKQEEETR